MGVHGLASEWNTGGFCAESVRLGPAAAKPAALAIVLVL